MKKMIQKAFECFNQNKIKMVLGGITIVGLSFFSAKFVDITIFNSLFSSNESTLNQEHSGGGDNVAGDKIENIFFQNQEIKREWTEESFKEFERNLKDRFGGNQINIYTEPNPTEETQRLWTQIITYFRMSEDWDIVEDELGVVFLFELADRGVQVSKRENQPIEIIIRNCSSVSMENCLKVGWVSYE